MRKATQDKELLLKSNCLSKNLIMNFNPNTFWPLLCMFLAIVCGIFVVIQNPKAKLNRIFLCICITFAAWFSFYIPFNFHHTDKFLITWFRISYCFISFIPITCFTFVSTYLQVPKNEFWFKINLLIGLTFSILSITTNWIVQGVIYYPWHPYPLAGVLHPFLIISSIHNSSKESSNESSKESFK